MRVSRGRHTKDLSAVSTCNCSKRVRRGRNSEAKRANLLLLVENDCVVC